MNRGYWLFTGHFINLDEILSISAPIHEQQKEKLGSYSSFNIIFRNRREPVEYKIESSKHEIWCRCYTILNGKISKPTDIHSKEYEKDMQKWEMDDNNRRLAWERKIKCFGINIEYDYMTSILGISDNNYRLEVDKLIVQEHREFVKKYKLFLVDYNLYLNEKQIIHG